jgi:hypothetical protein
MSQEMRDMSDKQRQLMSEANARYLKRRLPIDVFAEMERVTSVKPNKSITESSLKRIESHLMKHDCAVITSFRDEMINCAKEIDSEEVLNIFKNKGKNISLKSALLTLGYGVTKVKGSYIENYLEDNSVEVKEDSFFVVNLNDDSDFIETIIELGEVFCQDSILIMERGGENNYLVGTNYAKYPGYKNIESLGVFTPNKEGQNMTRVNKRPFIIETFKTSQINTKRLIIEWGRPIVNMIKNK